MPGRSRWARTGPRHREPVEITHGGEARSPPVVERQDDGEPPGEGGERLRRARDPLVLGSGVAELGEHGEHVRATLDAQSAPRGERAGLAREPAHRIDDGRTGVVDAPGVDALAHEVVGRIARGRVEAVRDRVQEHAVDLGGASPVVVAQAGLGARDRHTQLRRRERPPERGVGRAADDDDRGAQLGKRDLRRQQRGGSVGLREPRPLMQVRATGPARAQLVEELPARRAAAAPGSTESATCVTAPVASSAANRGARRSASAASPMTCTKSGRPGALLAVVGGVPRTARA